jgi:aryl-alcohol dehydrogenase-like predicted oxidoreductase
VKPHIASNGDRIKQAARSDKFKNSVEKPNLKAVGIQECLDVSGLCPHCAGRDKFEDLQGKGEVDEGSAGSRDRHATPVLVLNICYSHQPILAPSRREWLCGSLRGTAQSSTAGPRAGGRRESANRTVSERIASWREKFAMQQQVSNDHPRLSRASTPKLSGFSLAVGVCFGRLEPPVDKGPTTAVHPHITHFGQTDLHVSRICQGTAFRRNRRGPEDTNAQLVLRRCIDIGINFFDSSNAYGWGGSELALGKAIQGCRSHVVICTKVHPALKPEGTEAPKMVAFTPEFASREIEASLKRLATDYIDLYLLHNPDGITPPNEVAATMDALVRAGKIRYWGLSNHKAAQVTEFVKIGATISTTSRIAAVQNHYNITDRELEREMFPVLRRSGLALVPYSPMDEGRLVRANAEQDAATTALIAEVDRVGREFGATRPQVLLAWVLSHPEATCVLAGAERAEQVDENYRALDIVLTAHALSRLNRASDLVAIRQKEGR